MNQEKVEQVSKAAERALRVPERLGWTITTVVYGHGKVLVQALTPSGKCAQFTEKVT